VSNEPATTDTPPSSDNLPQSDTPSERQ
jgi:hypothetical protein